MNKCKEAFDAFLKNPFITPYSHFKSMHEVAYKHAWQAAINAAVEVCEAIRDNLLVGCQYELAEIAMECAEAIKKELGIEEYE